LSSHRIGIENKAGEKPSTWIEGEVCIVHSINLSKNKDSSKSYKHFHGRACQASKSEPFLIQKSE